MAWLDRGSNTWNRWVDTGDHLGLPRVRAARCDRCGGCCARSVPARCSSRSTRRPRTLRLHLQPGARRARLDLAQRPARPGRLEGGCTVPALAGPADRTDRPERVRDHPAPVMFSRFMAPSEPYLYEGTPVYPDTLMVGDQPVRNIYAYDAQGHPLVGVQLVDENGRRLSVPRQDDMDYPQRILAPWMNGQDPPVQRLPDARAGHRPGDDGPRRRGPPADAALRLAASGDPARRTAQRAGTPQTAAQKAAAGKKAARENAQKKAQARQKALKAEQGDRRSGNGG